MLSTILAIVLQASAEAPPAPPAKPAEVSAAASNTPAKGALEDKNASKSNRVCINDAAPGSKIPTRRCMDRAEYLRQQQESKENLDAIQRSVGVKDH